jgi:carbonic anhydrase
MISDAVAAGTLGIVGANYKLLEGTAVPDILIGNLKTTPTSAK